MRSLALSSLLPLSLLLSSSLGSPACFEVEYHGLEYTSSSDQTVFTYSLSSSSEDGCKQALSFTILGECPLAECPEASPSSPSHEGWSWNLPQDLGTNLTYQVYVPGNIQGVLTGQWAIKTADAVVLGLTCVPDCTTTPPTQPPTEPPTQPPTQPPTEEPTIPNVGEPCELVVPASLTLNFTGTETVEVSLASQPDGEVVVELSSDCAFLDGCTLTFDPTNWAEPQSVGVSNDPSNPARLCSITLSANGTNECEGAINITKGDAPKTESVCYGDPYVFTFDAVRYRLTQTTEGEDFYYLLRQPNGELIVQTDVQPCAIGECNNGAAIRYRGAFFQLLMDGNGTLTPSDNGELEAEGITVSNPSADSVMLDLNSQAAIRLTAEFIASMNIYSLRVSIRLGVSYRGNVAGLVGNFNGNRNDERVLPDGSQAADLAVFEVAWRVPAAENLFDDPTAAIGTLFGAQPYTSQTFPFVCEAS